MFVEEDRVLKAPQGTDHQECIMFVEEDQAWKDDDLFHQWGEGRAQRMCSVIRAMTLLQAHTTIAHAD
eukprot:1171906-Rhodomonas_salina.5